MSRAAQARLPPVEPTDPVVEDESPRAFAATRALEPAELRSAAVRWPRPERLAEPLELPRGKVADGARTLELHTVGDLLHHLPRDRREARTVATLTPGEQATVLVEVQKIASRPVRRRGMRPLVEATVADESGSMRATFFNQPWLVKRYPPGTRVALHGKAEGTRGFRVSGHALTDTVGGEGAGGEQGVAHYPATEGLSSTQLLALVSAHRAYLDDVAEALPGRLRAAERLTDRTSALRAMHFPERPEDPEAARQRLAFEELLLVQLVFLRRRARRRAHRGAPRLNEPPSLTERWLAAGLPFALTDDQKRAIEVIREDLADARPTQRLLMGEVGSGKTVVALYAMLRAVEHGMQAALMAPTETLAEQHFATLQTLMAHEAVPIALLTGSTPARRRRDTLGKLSSGELALVVGTHALIEPTVEFGRLAVAVVDEQHRFGVRQRAALDAKARRVEFVPHVLHMTATPIPRTLALLGYGDLDVTQLRELPRGRRPIATKLVSGERARADAYEQMREELRAGRQAFVVCPLVSESEASEQGGIDGAAEVRAATAEFERLAREELRDHRLVLLHGQMPAREKQAAMATFAAGEADVLVATTVIEVGIDVPNATVMLVENAERYGISQLHQLRGRIGRGEHASTCLLLGPAGSRRLRALVEHRDGFRLAEIDLELRKEGELVGTRQSGLGQFALARLPDDQALLERARARAEAIVRADPQLEHPEHGLLADALQAAYGAEQLDPIPA